MVVPYKTEEVSKKEQVRQMFDTIAPKYDFLNHFLSAGIDKRWRKKVCKIVSETQPLCILDMASGTGDLALAMSRLEPKPTKIIGIDLSEKMLEVGRKKVTEKGLTEIIAFQSGDAEAIEEEKDSFDVVTCAFGVRNFENVPQGLSEFYRVLKPKGRLVILELSLPTNPLCRGVYNIYFRHVLPLWGKLFSKDKSAYQYLPESVIKFPKRENFLQTLEKIGFGKVYAKPLTFGIATIFVAEK